MKNVLLIIGCLYGFIQSSFAQTESTSSLDFDEIEVRVKSVELSPKGDSVTVVLFLQSYLKYPRELKINTFATGLLNPEGKTMFYDSMMIGKVKITLADRQNYIHYLLRREDPVLYVIKTPNWKKNWGKPQQFRITLEDHEETGKFLQLDIPL